MREVDLPDGRGLFEREIPGCLKITDAGADEVTEVVALEVPVPFSIDGAGYKVLTCTPKDLEDLAIGVAFTGGVIDSASDVDSIEVVKGEDGFQIDLRLCLTKDSETVADCRIADRRVADRMNDGLKVDAIRVAMAESYPAEAIWTASKELDGKQGMRTRSGATHAAAFVDRSGRFIELREDVGRHNAVDKLIGSLLRERVDPASGFMFLSSRCAYELMAKAVAFRVPLIATVSAPTTAAVSLAEASGVTLCAFARGERFTVYAHPESIALPR